MKKKIIQFLMNYLLQLRHRAGARQAAMLVKIISDKNLTAQEREHYFRSLDFINGPEKEAALLELLTSK